MQKIPDVKKIYFFYRAAEFPYYILPGDGNFSEILQMTGTVMRKIREISELELSNKGLPELEIVEKKIRKNVQ